MAAVAHGGDAGADPPGGPWNPPRSHAYEEEEEEEEEEPRVRGRTTNKALRDAYKANGMRPLDISFDMKDQKTVRPIGKHGQYLISLIGSRVGDPEFPKHYPSWKHVPMTYKIPIMPEVEKYFDMRRWFVGGQRENLARAGIDQICQDRYKDAKHKLKKNHFESRGGYESPDNLRNSPPTGYNRDKIWIPFVDMITSDKHKQRAEVNSVNRSKQKFSSRHGS